MILLDNKIVTVGYTKSSDIKLDGLKYKENMTESFIIEYDYDGKMLNHKVYGGTKNDILNDIIVAIPDTASTINNTTDYIVVGYSNSRHGLFNGNNKDYYSKVLRYSSDLDLITEK